MGRHFERKIMTGSDHLAIGSDNRMNSLAKRFQAVRHIADSVFRKTTSFVAQVSSLYMSPFMETIKQDCESDPSASSDPHSVVATRLSTQPRERHFDRFLSSDF